MGEIVNLNKARKMRNKANDKSRAAANRLGHGRTLAERQTENAELDRAKRRLDGAKLDD